MRYLDTSLIVAAFTNEQGTVPAQGVLRAAEDDPLAISDWVVTETAAGLSRKVRERRLGTRDRRNAWTAFNTIVESTFVVLTVIPANFRAAAELVSDPETTLRSGDALHLAIAAAAGATVYTLDRGVSAAASRLQIPAVLAGGRD